MQLPGVVKTELNYATMGRIDLQNKKSEKIFSTEKCLRADPPLFLVTLSNKLHSTSVSYIIDMCYYLQNRIRFFTHYAK